ncbi:MAG: DUF896 domain-containing protein [Culicoidibacterales bacterium]
MDKNMIDRINELAKKKKTEGLTAAETKEQQELRARYLKEFRSGFNSHLMNLKIVDPNGKDVTPKKLVKAKKAYRKTDA